MNRGAQELGKRLTKRGAQQRLAEALDTTSGVVTHWLNDTRKPNARFRGLLNSMYGIPWLWWDEPPIPDDATDGGDAAA